MGIAIAAALLSAKLSTACDRLPRFRAARERAAQQDLPVSERSKSYRDAIQACPKDPGIYQEYSSFLIGTRDFEGALVWIRKGLINSPSDPDLLRTEAAALLPVGRARDALDVLNRVPGSSETRFYAGLAQRSLNDHAAAQQSFREAWRLGKRDPYVLYSLVQEDYALGDKAAGMGDFKNILENYPDSPWVHQLLGDAFFSKGNNDEAKTEYLKALSLKSDLLNVNFRLGYLAFEAGNTDAAETYFKSEVRVNPSYVDSYVFLAETQLKTGKVREAVTELRMALQLDPGSELIYRRLAAALSQSDNLREAAAVLEKAEARFPDDPGFPAELARILRNLNRSADAEVAADRARHLISEQHRKQELAPVK